MTVSARSQRATPFFNLRPMRTEPSIGQTDETGALSADRPGLLTMIRIPSSPGAAGATAGL